VAALQFSKSTHWLEHSWFTASAIQRVLIFFITTLQQLREGNYLKLPALPMCSHRLSQHKKIGRDAEKELQLIKGELWVYYKHVQLL